jgi:hypothetical protein
MEHSDKANLVSVVWVSRVIGRQWDCIPQMILGVWFSPKHLDLKIKTGYDIIPVRLCLCH